MHQSRNSRARASPVLIVRENKSRTRACENGNEPSGGREDLQSTRLSQGLKEAQRGCVPCLRPHSWQADESRAFPVPLMPVLHPMAAFHSGDIEAHVCPLTDQ